MTRSVRPFLAAAKQAVVGWRCPSESTSRRLRMSDRRQFRERVVTGIQRLEFDLTIGVGRDPRPPGLRSERRTDTPDRRAGPTRRGLKSPANRDVLQGVLADWGGYTVSELDYLAPAFVTRRRRRFFDQPSIPVRRTPCKARHFNAVPWLRRQRDPTQEQELRPDLIRIPALDPRTGDWSLRLHTALHTVLLRPESLTTPPTAPPL